MSIMIITRTCIGKKRLPKVGNLTSTRCPGVGNLTLAHVKMSSSPSTVVDNLYSTIGARRKQSTLMFLLERYRTDFQSMVFAFHDS